MEIPGHLNKTLLRVSMLKDEVTEKKQKAQQCIYHWAKPITAMRTNSCLNIGKKHENRRKRIGIDQGL